MGCEARIEATTPHRARLTVSDFMLLHEAGAFAGHARSELIEGEIYIVNAVYRRHSWAVQQLFLRLLDALKASTIRPMQETSSLLSDVNLPEPDIVLTTEPRGDGPIPLASIRLIVEVADSSLTTDLGLKAELYARHAIAEYWVADIEGQRIVRHWAPADGAYAECDAVPFGEDISSRTIDGLMIGTRDLI